MKMSRCKHYLIVFRLEFPFQHIKVAYDVVLAGCLGDDTCPMLNPPPYANLQPSKGLGYAACDGNNPSPL